MALTSLYTGISGLSASSLALSVIGDNIANMNTTAYKSSTVQFGDVLSSSLSTGGGSAQVGRGVLVETVSPDFTQGSFSTTSNSLDMAIDGNGFFEVKDNTGTYYTRAGAFSTDKDGNVVDPNHCVLQGYLYNTSTGNFAGSTSDINLSSLGSSNQATSNMTISDNLDSRSTLNATTMLTSAGNLNLDSALSGADTNLLTVGGTLDSSASSMIYDVNNPAATSNTSTTVAVTDSTGNPQSLTVYYVNTAANTWAWHVQDDANPGADLGTGAMTFDSITGTLLTPASGAATFSFGSPAQTIDLNLASLTEAGANAATLGASTLAFDPANSATYDYMVPTTVQTSSGSTETVNMYYTKINATDWTYHAVVPAANSVSGLDEVQSTGSLTFDGTTGLILTPPSPSVTFTFAGGVSQTTTLNFMDMVQSASASSVTASGFDLANPDTSSQFSTAVTVFDSLGNSHMVTVYFNKATDSPSGNTWTWNAVVNPSDTRSGVAEIQDSGTMTFDSSGALTSSTTSSALYNFSTGAANQPITLNFDNFTQYASDSSTVSQSQDGFPYGSLTSLAISQDGIMSGVFSNGQSSQIAKIALAKFTSPTSLTKDGRNLYSPSYASGGASEGFAQTSGRGRIISGSLELSNVDLAQQFVNMISAQRMFQANSRVISVTDSLLQEITQLAR